jgi:hypothetical protein
MKECVCLCVCVFDPVSYICGCRSPQLYDAHVREVYDKLWVWESDGTVRRERRGEWSGVEWVIGVVQAVEV